jgi:hypothetical protein
MAEDDEPGLLDMLLDQLANAPGSEEALGHLAAHFEAVPADEFLAGIAKIGRSQPLEVAARYVAVMGAALHGLHPDAPGLAAADAIAWARATCDRALAGVRGLSDDDTWQLVLAAAVLRGQWPIADAVREISGGGQGNGECPHCDRSMSVTSDGKVAQLLKPNGDSGEPVEAAPRAPVEELARLSEGARATGHEDIAKVLDTLNGTAQCPYCKRTCSVWTVLVESRSP